MSISETQLSTWSKQGPTGQFTATYETIRNVLNDSSSPYYPQNFSIFLQGSYKNDTNVYADSDVDVVIRLDSIFYPDLDVLSAEDKANYNAQKGSASYSLADFKKSVVAWLVKQYGNKVDVGKKAITIKGNGSSRRDADVLVCAKLRRYHSFPSDGTPTYTDGVCFFLPDGTRVENFPELHSSNCTTKHQATSKWFKHTVRIFKNLRNTMTDIDIFPFGDAPSYFIEGMLYNVPVDRFGGSEQTNFIDVLEWLEGADRSKFLCANKMFYLLRSSPVTWSADKCTKFLVACRTYWDA
jgi:hypothetical protein